MKLKRKNYVCCFERLQSIGQSARRTKLSIISHISGGSSGSCWCGCIVAVSTGLESRAATCRSSLTICRKPGWYNVCRAGDQPKGCVAARMNAVVAKQIGCASGHGLGSEAVARTAARICTEVCVCTPLPCSGLITPRLTAIRATACSRHPAAIRSGCHPASTALSQAATAGWR